MSLQKIIRLGGAVVFDDLSMLDQSSDVSLAIGDLKEDLFQACFPLEQIIDIGWYPEFCEEGAFRVVLVSNLNWDSPVCSAKAKSWVELDVALDEVLSKVKHL
jgi:hypothetical protein